MNNPSSNKMLKLVNIHRNIIFYSICYMTTQSSIKQVLQPFFGDCSPLSTNHAVWTCLYEGWSHEYANNPAINTVRGLVILLTNYLKLKY